MNFEAKGVFLSFFGSIRVFKFKGGFETNFIAYTHPHIF